jgi:hypothetical protein
MKNNTEALKNSLRQALLNAPDDFALNDAKSLIVRALNVVESLEKKRSIRESNQEKRKLELSVKKYDYSNTLKAIDKEINSEKTKLEEIKNKRNSKKLLDSPDEESGEIQNVFG